MKAETIIPFDRALTRVLTPTPTITLPPDAWRPQLDAYDPSLAVAREACALFIAEMAAASQQDLHEFVRARRPGRWLTLEGKNGCGKTLLARQLFAQARRLNPGNRGMWGPFYGFDWIPDQPTCTWIDGPSFASRFRAGEYTLPESFAHDWCVVFDELGADRDPSSFVADGLHRFCASRLGKWTIFTTNLTTQEIADRIDARVASRLIRDRNIKHRITAGDYALRRSNTQAQQRREERP